MLKIAISAPGAALRVGLRALLGAEPGIHISLEAASLSDLEELPEGTSVIVAAETDYPPLSSGQISQRFPGASVLYLVHPGGSLPPALAQSSPAGWGLLPLDATPEELVAAVRALNEGLVAASPELLRAFLAQRPSSEKEQPHPLGENPLTRREVDVLQRLALGLTNKQIALALAISEHTVKFHISSIYSKLDVLNRADAVRTGISRGWIAI